MGEARRRREFEKNNPNLCALCLEPSVSRDHVPPKCIFTGDRTNLVTVPTCDKHNNQRSGADEKLRDWISIECGTGTKERAALWQKTLRSYKRGSNKKRKLLDTLQWQPEIKRYTALVDKTDIDEVLSGIVRGLYFHHYKRRLLPHVQIDINQMPLNSHLASALSVLSTSDVGKGQFVYGHGRDPQHNTGTIWVLIFHQSLGFLVNTGQTIDNE